MKWKTQYDRGDVKYRSPVGSYLRSRFVLDVDSDGVRQLVSAGVTNQYESIQSHRDSCDLALIISRLDPVEVNGMMSTYTFDDLATSEICDITQMPKTAGEMLNLSKKGNEIFSGLPDEIRKEFNYSSDKFIRSFGTQEFADKINALNAKYQFQDGDMFRMRRGKLERINSPEANPAPTPTVTKEGENSAG